MSLFKRDVLKKRTNMVMVRALKVTVAQQICPTKPLVPIQMSISDSDIRFKQVQMIEAKPGIAFVEFEDEVQSSVAMHAGP
ncbi:hypothetical protein Dsin_018353 [Dipteronia sinensis]|uniref:RRM domain-containing protein n=1 Tax=Dipteronia sinensis TaxID=43782 RepID=A0AAE0A5R7_9ROSI|nr:hypothetical protein Dsin_018353 [Dipteronia sinensis]